MNFKQLRIFFFVIIVVLCATANMNAQQSHDEQHLEVSLRMIGHEVLLCTGDNTSRVLPIEREEGKYKIKFDTEFKFDPEDLVTIVNRVMEETPVEGNYFMTVKACESEDVVYMYEFGRVYDPSVTLCGSRETPKGCYNLVFDFMDYEDKSELFVASNDKGFLGSSLFKYLLGFLLLLSAVGIFLFVRKKRRESEIVIDPNVISLGAYQFNKRNTELLHDEKRIELTGKEANLLILLYDAVNTTMEREVILKRVWGDEGDYVGRTLDVFISKLRKKLDADPKVKIVNIRGVGYKLVIDA